MSNTCDFRKYTLALSVLAIIVTNSCNQASFSQNQNSKNPATDAALPDAEATGLDSAAAAPGSDDKATANNGGDASAKDAVSALEIACAKADVKKYEQTITFPAPATGCEWGTDKKPVSGNWGEVNGRISAHREEAAKLNLPKGAILCKLSLDFTDGANQSMTYDDEIYVTFNNLLLIGSQKLNLGKLFEKKGQFLQWNWDKLVGTDYEQSVGKDSVYCAGADAGLGSCDIPPTQTAGKIAIALDDKLIQEAALTSGAAFDPKTGSLSAGPGYDFSFITIGDNDPEIDCMHSKVQMAASATYITP